MDEHEYYPGSSIGRLVPLGLQYLPSCEGKTESQTPLQVKSSRRYHRKGHLMLLSQHLQAIVIHWRHASRCNLHNDR